MDSLRDLFKDDILDDYDESMDVAEDAPPAAPLAAPTTTPVSVEPPTPVGVPAPTVTPSSDVTPQNSSTSDPLSEASGPSGSNVSLRVLPKDPNTCRVCGGTHPLRHCKAFRRFRPEKRLRTVVLHHYCCRCLALSHTFKSCPSTYKCRLCNGDHHILLHFNSAKKQTPIAEHSSSKKNPPKKLSVPKTPSSSVSQVCPLPIRHIVTFSPTMIVKLQTSNRSIPVRAALDPCSKISYICENLVHQLRLPVSSMDRCGYCRLTICSAYDSEQKISITAKVTKMKGVKTPPESVPDIIKENFAGFQLADPRFNVSSSVALVLGPEVTPQIIKGRIYSSPGLPLAQYTIFGWVISGQSPI